MTKQTDKNNIIEKISGFKELLENPLWHLCRSNTENAMSNFWAYLIEISNDPTIILGKKNQEHWAQYGKLTGVLREKNYMDLQLKFEKGTIVIENKFKSLADSQQLTEYKNKIQEHTQNYHFFLITPTETPDFKENLTWLSYEDVKKNIEAHTTELKNKNIIKEYIKLLDNIINLGKNKKLKDYRLCQFWKIKDTETTDLISTLQQEKLYAFVTKNLASQYLTDCNNTEPKIPTDIKTEVGFTRSAPVISWKKETKNKEGDRHIEGIQIQNGQFRFLVESIDKKSEIDTRLLDEWNSKFKDVKFHRSNYNKFGDSFKYRYIKLEKEDTLKGYLTKVFEYWQLQ